MDEHLYTLALKFLSLRPRSEKEVRDNLKKKNASENQITLIIQKLHEQKFVNDYEFANWWIEQRMRFRPKGWRILEIELKQKGISDEIIKEIRMTNEESREKNETEQARELIVRKFSKYKELSRQELYSKIGGFLSRRGFDYDTIKTCIDEILGK